MSDPYRGQRAAKLEALLGEEREMLVRAGWPKDAQRLLAADERRKRRAIKRAR